MAMEPEARIAPPEGNGEPLENMSGGRDRVRGAGWFVGLLMLCAICARACTRGCGQAIEPIYALFS